MTNLARTSLALSCLVACLATACGDDAGGSGVDGSGGTSGEGGSAGDGGASGDGGSGGDGASSAVSGATSSGGQTSSATGSQASSSGAEASSSVTTSASSTTGGGVDPYAAERQTCVDKINALRATEALPPYGRWTSAEACSDEQATSDEETNTPHGSFPSCGESGQNECLGHGPEGIEQCLDQMWAEKDLPQCAGCSLCHEQQGNCANCVFQDCGHYVNMSALYFDEVACGFSALGGWDVQNFR